MSEALEPGERVLWRGCPDVVSVLRPAFWLPFVVQFDSWIAIGAVLALYVAVDWIVALADLPMYLTALFLLPLLLIAGQHLKRWRRFNSTIYAVTNRRALTISLRPTLEIFTLGPADLHTATVVNERGPRGDIVLRERQTMVDGEYKVVRDTFHQIEDPDAVRDLLLDLRARADTAAESG